MGSYFIQVRRLVLIRHADTDVAGTRDDPNLSHGRAAGGTTAGPLHRNR